MTPIDLKQYFDSNPPPETFELKPWAKITDTKKFLESSYSTLSHFNGDYRDCPSYWWLKDFHSEILKRKALI